MEQVNLGPLTPYHPPPVGALAAYNVNRAGQFEVIWQPTYDYQVYPALGASQFTFFQTTVGAGGSTLATTNIRSAGQFPRPQEFLVTGIQVFYEPGGVVARNGVGAAGDIQENWNDVTDVMMGNAFLDLFIGSKSYLQDAPLAKFAQQFRITGTANQAAATTVAATTIAPIVDYSVHCGRYYSITPVKIPANQNFNVTLNFPALIPTAVAGRIGVILDGFLYRLSQ